MIDLQMVLELGIGIKRSWDGIDIGIFDPPMKKDKGPNDEIELHANVYVPSPFFWHLNTPTLIASTAS
jgi:hypothetical protein